MPMLSAVSNELYVNKAFVGLNGAGYQIAGGYELSGTGVPKRKIKKAIKDIEHSWLVATDIYSSVTKKLNQIKLSPRRSTT